MKAPHKKTYEAHVAYELARLENAVENGFLKQELDLLWASVGKLPLSKVISRKALTTAVERQVTSLPVTDGMVALIAQVAARLVSADINGKTALGDLLMDEDRQVLQKQALALSKLRKDLIHATVNNPLYADTVADLLYHGIRDYVAAGSEFTKKVPGMGSLMNRGGDFIGKRMEGLEGKIEEKVRGYISSNMHKILERSEAMMQSNLTAGQLAKIGDEVWHAMKPLPPRIDIYVNDKDVAGFSETGADIWRHFRETDYFKAQLANAIDSIYKHAGKRHLSSWLADIGIETDWLLEELQQLWPAIWPALDKSGYLEQVTRSRLEPFYAQL